MKKYFLLFIGILLLIVVINNCSENKNPVASSTHSSEWNEKGSDSFHGTKVLEAGYVSCKSCHGADLTGGKSNISCFTCHQTYPHPAEWMMVGDSNFHGEYINTTSGSIEYCKGCHGSDLSGGQSKVSCYKCHKDGSLP